MYRKLAMIFCLVSVILVGTLVFCFSPSMDYMTIFHAFKLMLPAGIVAYIGGYYAENILRSAKVETKIITGDIQRKFVDDLLLTPDQVLKMSWHSDDDIPKVDSNITNNRNDNEIIDDNKKVEE